MAIRLLNNRLSRLGMVASVCLLLGTASAQTESQLDGIVTAMDGQPISGLLVYGSESRTCCPVKRDSTKTDDQGRFHLDHPGAVIHFSAEKFRPQAFVVSAATNIHISLERSESELIVPVCERPTPGHKRIGWSRLGPQFDAPLGEVDVQFGHVDTDYVRHVVRAKNSSTHIEFWFGPMAISAEPDDDLFISSVKFSQRNIVSPRGQRIGMDSWGELPSGMRWRQTAIAAEGGSLYQAVPPKTVDLFDQIVDSICMTEGRFIEIENSNPKLNR